MTDSRKPPRRRKSREVAVQMLYQVDLNPDTSGKEVTAQIREQIDDYELASLARTLFGGVMEHRDAIDATLEETAENWSVRRMAVVDRNILRLGLFELEHRDVPPSVVIDECVELAKRFGDKNSSRFVNGILDRLVKRRKAGGE